MKHFTRTGLERDADQAWSMYEVMRQKFGDEKAWQFVLNYYHGAGRDNG